jgi:hypothetical protein
MRQDIDEAICSCNYRQRASVLLGALGRHLERRQHILKQTQSTQFGLMSSLPDKAAQVLDAAG